MGLEFKPHFLNHMISKDSFEMFSYQTHDNDQGNVTTYKEGLIAPQGIVLDELGNIFVAESGGHAIRKIDNQGNVTTFAGQRGID